MTEAAGSLPILVHDAEYVFLLGACEFTGLSADTIRRWCKRYLIARPSRGNTPLKIHKPALSMLLHGDHDALRLLRMGEYTDWRVIRHYEFSGIPLPGGGSVISTPDGSYPHMHSHA